MGRLLDGNLIRSAVAGGAGGLDPGRRQASVPVALLNGYLMEVPA
jgi:hypothetical protein